MGFIKKAVDTVFDVVTDVAKAVGPAIPIVGQVFTAHEQKKIAEQQAEEGRRQAAETKALQEKQAAQEKAATEEEARRMAAGQQRRLSMAKAQAAASGMGGVSTQIYIDALEKAGKEEIDWLRQVGAQTYESALEAGRISYDRAMTSFWGMEERADAAFWGSVGEATTTAATLAMSYGMMGGGGAPSPGPYAVATGGTTAFEYGHVNPSGAVVGF